MIDIIKTVTYVLPEESLLAYLHTLRMRMTLSAALFQRTVLIQMQNPACLRKSHIDVVVRSISVVWVACLRLHRLVFAALNDSTQCCNSPKMGCIKIPGSKGSKEFSFTQSKIESQLTHVCLPRP